MMKRTIRTLLSLAAVGGLAGGAVDGCVAYLQEQLNKLMPNWGMPLLAVDGSFGPATEKAVVFFQKDVNTVFDAFKECDTLDIATDGRVGPQTRTELDYWGDNTSCAML